MGFKKFVDSIDCIIMGRKTFEIILEMKLTPDQWPYGSKRIIVLSSTLKIVPDSYDSKIDIYSGDLILLIKKLENEGYRHLYIDGGKTIQSFIGLELLTNITITRTPILIGEGIPLFSSLNRDINLNNAKAKVFPNDYIQVTYDISYL